MAFQVSPGVNVSEVDLSTVVPAVSTTEGAIAGVFNWGPAKTRVLVDSEETLVARFGKPIAGLNPETFFTAANFLAYGNKLFVSRVVDADVSRNATVSGTGVLIENEDKLRTFENIYPLTRGITLKDIRIVLNNAKNHFNKFDEWLNENIIKKYNFSSFNESLIKMHFPSVKEDIENRENFRKTKK